MYREANMWYTPPKAMPQIDERLQLTADEVRHERARQLAVLLGVPTRVRGTKVEVLFGDRWAEQRDPLS